MPGILFCKHPVVHLKDTVFRTEELLKVFLACAVIEYLLWREVSQELLDVVVCAFTGEKLTCGDVEQAQSAGCFTEVYGSEEVVFLVVEYVIAHGNTRRNQFGDATLHHFVHLGEPFLAFDGGAFFLPRWHRRHRSRRSHHSGRAARHRDVWP